MIFSAKTDEGFNRSKMMLGMDKEKSKIQKMPLLLDVLKGDVDKVKEYSVLAFEESFEHYGKSDQGAGH